MRELATFRRNDIPVVLAKIQSLFIRERGTDETRSAQVVIADTPISDFVGVLVYSPDGETTTLVQLTHAQVMGLKVNAIADRVHPPNPLREIS